MGNDDKGLELPTRPVFLDSIGLRQAVLRSWLPLLMLVLLGVASFLPLQNLSVQSVSEADTEMATEYTLYQDHYQVNIIGIDDLVATDEDNLSMFKGMMTSFSVSHGDGINHAQLEKMSSDTGKIAESHASTSWWSVLFAFILVLLVLERSSKGWLHRNAPRVLEGVAALTALMLLIFVFMGLVDYFDLGDAAPDALGHVSVEGGLYGEATNEEAEGLVPETIAWGPGLAMWAELLALLLVIPLILLHGLEAMTPGWWGESRNSSPRSIFEESKAASLDVNDGVSPRLTSLSAAVPSLAAITALVLLISAIFLPWMGHFQQYQVQDEEGDWSTHEVSWSTGLFGTTFSNSTMFDNATGIKTSTAEPSENASVGKTDDLITGMSFRYFFGISLLIIPLVLSSMPGDKRSAIGSPRLWLATCLLLSCWVLSGISSGIAEGGAAMANDAKLLLPHEDLLVMWSSQGTADGLMGHATGFTMLQDAEWIGSLVTAGWGPGVAMMLVDFAIVLLFLASLCSLTGIHENASSKDNTRIARFTAAFHGTTHQEASWLAGPKGSRHGIAFAGIAVLLLLTTFMGGTMEGVLVSNTTSSSGPALKQYRVDIRDSYDETWIDGDLNGGDTLELTIDIPASYVENATYIDFSAGCSDNRGDWGSNNPVGEDTDAIRIEIALPAELGGDILVEEEDCVDNWSFFESVGDSTSNRATHTIDAMNAEAAALKFHGDDTMMITIDVKITAITKGSMGGTGFNQDDEMYAAFYSTWGGFYSMVDEVDEDD